MTSFEFFHLTGRSAEHDDLARVNCDRRGEFGHHGCGVCVHRLPAHMCEECLYGYSAKYQTWNYTGLNGLIVMAID